MDALVERHKQDAEVLTATVATAVAIALSKDALAKWQAEHGMAPTGSPPMDAAMLGQMVARFPGSFKVNAITGEQPGRGAGTTADGAQPPKRGVN